MIYFNFWSRKMGKQDKTKVTVAILMIIASIFLFCCAGCESEAHEEKRVEVARKRSEYKYKNLVANCIWYVYDPKVNICYAITEVQGTGMAARTMTVVPYEKVKKYALVVEYERHDEGYWPELKWKNSSPE
jgi:hypothetical protein